ncbi:MAG: DUF5678 domain-containing protein [Planctomycetales bacterium]|nr:DUF5678 domain-containing protein [Planctomycetales bacterium]
MPGTARPAHGRRGTAPRPPARSRLSKEIRRNAGKYVAIAADWSRVVAVGKTFSEALAKARADGHDDAAILLALRDYGAVAY